MKKLLIALAVIITIISCGTQKKITPTLSKDGSEYELLIFDARFESWFVSHTSEAMKKSNSYYEHQNWIYVQEWNNKYSSGHPFFQSYIDYRQDVNYGLDFNYKLYMYFQYVEKELKVKING